MLHFEVDKVTCTDTELVCFHQRIGLILSKLQPQLDSVERYLCTTDTSNEETRRMFSEAINHCMKLVERFGEFDSIQLNLERLTLQMLALVYL